ncbi:AfsR family transcriptional regulator [Amycolatopsis sp. WAC 01375]|uniref:BTAD domain-containing putative transcriptional regulator n=1 Tax=unclassified Amycolatopsis TaxID=2618356 RepID=UPI000F79189A|nr:MULTISPECIES: BTAD domain-containing putative transcriptional regulator [unclassified Amycolatopsis]RSM74524.1 AfsR family transcriptional regulator [Amycolatopsis sp. WAC 01375]RSN21563.1 AfsR family transcriptional regulator [Amycolatopsis sp. WAC 01416]
MRFGVLGPLAAWTTAGEPVVVPEAKVRLLLAALLSREGRAASVSSLTDDLWGEHPPGNPGNTLQTKVSQLRRTLDRAEPGAREIVTHQPTGYVLAVEAGDLDVHRFRALTARARDTVDPRARAALLADALALWRGHAYAGFEDELFAVAAAQRLEEERLLAEEDRAEARLTLGEHGLLTGELAALVSRHPLRERLRGLLMRTLYAAGRHSEALESYAELRARLRDESGLEPGPDLAALHQAILTRSPDLEPVRAAEPVRGNLPESLTELIGRTTAVKEVGALVTDTRLVTLTGPGGVGKTRLAIEAASKHAMADGTWLVELAGLDNVECPTCPPEDLVAVVLAAVLDLREEATSAKSVTQSLADALRDKEILLVLDNCEQVVEPVAALVERLLAAAPRLRVLATSQEPLGLPGENVWAVPPLELPEQADFAAVRESSAVRLFTARAAAAAPGFTLDAENAAVVTRICRTLDGIPLALELAATRVRTLGVHELLARLDDRFGLLSSGRRGGPRRQQTLRAMIDWSWSLLSEPEQIVLRRLAVHAEGCGLDAAESVCSGGGIAAADVMDLVSRLVDRSLVVSRPGRSGEPRFRLLESVSAYALEHAERAGELDELSLRHARFHVELAERGDTGLRGKEQRRWLDRLDAEGANTRRALETLLRLGEHRLALRLVNATTWFWFLRGRLSEARRSLNLVLDTKIDTGDEYAQALGWCTGIAVLDGTCTEGAAEDTVWGIADSVARARTLWFLGYAWSTIGDLCRAEKLTLGALETARDIGEDWSAAAALSDRATHLIAGGDLTGAGRIAAQSAGVFDGLGERWGWLQASFVVGVLASIAGNYDHAARVHRESLRRAEELELWPEVAYNLSWLGRTALLTGDFEGAKEFHERARTLAVEHSFKPGEVYAETGLALGERRQGLFEEAEQRLLSVLDWHRRVESEAGSTLILAELGFIAEQRGDTAKAKRLQLDGLVIARHSEDPRAIALGLEGLAGAEAAAGSYRAAARLLGAAAASRRSVGAPLPKGERGDVDRITGVVMAALGETAFSAENAVGERTPIDQLVTDSQ